MNDLKGFFNPKSVAVVGVSQSPEKLGSVILNNLISEGFTGHIYPVNPKYVEVQGYICYDKVSSIPEDIDLVCICVPKKAVKDVVIDCGIKKVKGIVIISAGFGETGDDGKRLETEILNIAKQTGMRILGPNCLGFITPHSKCNVSFAASHPKPGHIAFLSQSGAICTALLDKAIPQNIGFSHFISIGNKPDISEIDILPYLQGENDVKVIAAYLEEVSYGMKLISTYLSSNTPKPFIILKPGRTPASKQAVQSHTGAMIGDREVFETAMKQNGIISANSITELFNLSKGFALLKPVKGKRVAIVTNAGGPGVIAMDEIMLNNLEIAKISEESKARLKAILPEASSLQNPIDILGEALADRYMQTMQVLSEDPNVDIILVLLTPQFVTQIKETASSIVSISKKTDKTIVPVFLGQEKIKIGEDLLHYYKLPVFDDISESLKVIHHMYQYESSKNKDRQQKSSILSYLSLGEFHNEISSIATDTPTALSEGLIYKIVNEVGIVTPPQKICSTIEECLVFANAIYPVVLKIPNSVIMHKTDENALILDIYNENDLRKAYTQLTSNKSSSKVLVQKQIKTEEELILGAKRDGNSEVYTTGKGFGHLLLFGKGGIYTEIYNDTSHVHLPASIDQIIDSIISTKIATILAGARGKQPLAIKPLLKTIVAIQKLLFLYPEIQSIDLNPLFIDYESVWAVDIKIMIQK